MRVTLPAIPFLFLAATVVATAAQGRKTCVVRSSGTSGTDDAVAVSEAFQQCGRRGRVVFEPTVYHINSVMNVSRLDDVDIDIQGTLLFSSDIQYWLKNSLSVGYQNQSTALVIGGDNVRIDGHGRGTIDGNGDYWYQWIKKQPNTSNYPGRPHAITFDGLTNSVVRNLTFLRSQMWEDNVHYTLPQRLA